MKPKKARTRPKQLSTPTPASERVRLVFDKLFFGSQTAMAPAIDISQPQLSRVLAGVAKPSARILAALAELPKVNPKWAATGVGEPFDSGSTKEHWTLPVVDSMDSIANGLDAMQSFAMHRSTAPDFHAKTRVWLRLKAEVAAAAVRFTSAEAGDLLLIETSTAAWRSSPTKLIGRLGLSRIAEDDELSTALVIFREVAKEGFRVDPVLQMPFGRQQRTSDVGGRQHRFFGNADEKVESPSPAPKPVAPKLSVVPFKNVLGFVLLLERELQT